jgi:hypothetical protein
VVKHQARYRSLRELGDGLRERGDGFALDEERAKVEFFAGTTKQFLPFCYRNIYVEGKLLCVVVERRFSERVVEAQGLPFRPYWDSRTEEMGARSQSKMFQGVLAIPSSYHMSIS